MDSLLTRLNAWRPFTAVVVGDFMLDQLLYGDAERLSADAPVPVLRVRRSEDRPGGAANLALDMVAMHGRVIACGVVGADEEGRRLREALESQGVSTSALVEDASRPTTVKRNLIGLAQARHPQKMFRVDFESTDPVSAAIEDRLFESFEASLKGADVVCIEDYAKGVCSPRLCARVIERAHRARVPVLVDPAAIEDYAKYRGATAITPNRTEAELATGMETNEDPLRNESISASLLESLDLEAVVLTLDRHGALLHRREGEPLHVPTVARDVYDVTGAGDMMLAALAAGRANGMTWPDAVRLANVAAGLEVEIFGVEPIPIETIHHAIVSERRRGKLRTLEEAVLQARSCQAHGKRVAFTNGCFDILHAGHVMYLEKARETADMLIVGLNTDESIRRIKGPDRPVNGQSDRAKVLGALEAVDAVVLFDDDTPISLIEEILPDVLVKGADWSLEDIVGREVVEARGGRVERIDLLEGRSTTSTIEKMRASDG